MNIKRTFLITYISLVASVFLVFGISTRIAYIERSEEIRQDDYRQIQAGCLSALALCPAEDSQSITAWAESYLNEALTGTNYQWVITSDNSIHSDEDPEKNYVFALPGTDVSVQLSTLSDYDIVPLHPHNLLLMILPMVIFFVISIYLATYMSLTFTKPIQSLLTAIREASNGNLNARCEIRTKNEIGELARTFNKMLHIISSNYEDLTSMHEELLANEEELHKNYDHIEFLAYHDVLTQLPNKLAFYEKVYNTISSPGAIDRKHAIYFVDLDNFKNVNDTLGHDYGDILLTQTAQKLNSMIRGGDILSRAGGDEFLIFRANISTIDEATQFGEEILRAFQEPFDLNGEIAYISMSIGISIYPLNGLSHTVLIKNADIAMYHSKDTGKNKLTIFTSTMEEQLQREAEVLDCLRQVLDNHEIYLEYQPQVQLSDNRVAGYEALMRINSAKLGLISPVEFIPVAETNGLIYDLGIWALREACTMNKNLIDRGYAPHPVAVNLSSLQLNRTGFLDELVHILQETGLPPEYLEVELTESMLVSSVTDAATMLQQIRALGIRVSLDDFGTGYSSLNYLAQLPINTLKIDKSFVDNVCHYDQAAHLVESIISLAHGLDITVIAEGVEEGNQLAFLHAQHCDLVQGYLVGKPLSPEQLTMLLD